MSKLGEYINLLPKALANPKEIIQGWYNAARLELGTLPEDQVEEVVRRRLICEGCDFMSKNAQDRGLYKTKREEKHCILCSCPIKSKSASMESVCGAQYYNEVHLDKESLEVKWTKYEGK